MHMTHERVRTRSTASLELLLRSLSKVRDGVESVPTGFMGSFPGHDAMQTAHEPLGIPLTSPADTLSPTGGEGRGEGVRFMARGRQECRPIEMANPGR